MPDRPRQFNVSTGFTLIEVVCSMVVLAMILSGVIAGYNRSVTRVYEQSLRERALAVAQRQMELLMGSEQEPEGAGLAGPDDLDPLFNWQMELKRVPINEDEPLTVKNSLIRAVVRVTCSQATMDQREPVSVERYFGNLKPRPGQQIAVPIPNQYEEEMWFVELRRQLGREPTPQEALTAFLKTTELPAEILESLDGSEGGN